MTFSPLCKYLYTTGTCTGTYVRTYCTRTGTKSLCTYTYLVHLTPSSHFIVTCTHAMPCSFRLVTSLPTHKTDSFMHSFISKLRLHSIDDSLRDDASSQNPQQLFFIKRTQHHRYKNDKIHFPFLLSFGIDLHYSQ
jgi:hypothetical protein